MSTLNFSNQFVQIQQITAENLLTEIDKIIEARLKEHLKVQPAAAPNTPEYLTREEVGELFKVSLPTIWAWCNKGYLKPYRLGNKVRFLKSEVLAAPKPITKLDDENLDKEEHGNSK